MGNPDRKAQREAPSERIKLLHRMEDVSRVIHRAIESNQVSDDGRQGLQELSNVLKKIEGKLATAQDHHLDEEEQLLLSLPESKREELNRLLPEIERALRQLIKRPQQESSEHGVQNKSRLLAMGCSPFNKLIRSPSPQEKGGGGGGGHKEDDEADPVSVKLLVRLAQHVLEPEQYYEWTTSYVDESRIYGWDEEAGKVMDALIGPDDGDFRAAAITGIHGSGKTALAQKVFVHDKAKDHFPLRLWVCVGPPDSEDRFNLLYRMLDNLGLDTNKIEDVVVDGADVVKKAREKEKERIHRDEQASVQAMKEKAREIIAASEENEEASAAGVEQDAKIKEEFDKLLKQEIEDSPAVQKSKIGLLLYILHMTLAKTRYLIVFDDIRVYGDDGWYNNLTLPPPPEGEWSDRLAYGLPKSTTSKRRNAVLVTCRKEDDARAMVRTGRVFRPPKLQVDNGWKLFDREYKQAKELKDAKRKTTEVGEDLLFKELEEMKGEIVEKCLGLPVAIIEAARGFALSDLQPLPEPAEDKIGSSKKGTQTEEATEAAVHESK